MQLLILLMMCSSITAFSVYVWRHAGIVSDYAQYVERFHACRVQAEGKLLEAWQQYRHDAHLRMRLKKEKVVILTHATYQLREEKIIIEVQCNGYTVIQSFREALLGEQ